LREAACAAADFVELHKLSGMHGDACANCGTVALRADQLEQNAMIARDAVIQQERRRLTYIQKQDVDVAVVIYVTERCAAA
jgi:hypothetical protein